MLTFERNVLKHALVIKGSLNPTPEVKAYIMKSLEGFVQPTPDQKQTSDLVSREEL